MFEVAFIYYIVVGILVFMTIYLFAYLLKKGRQIRRSIFITTVTMLMAVSGLVIELAVNSEVLIVVVITLSMGAMGAIISVGISLAIYK